MSNLLPCLVLVWLGFLVDTQLRTFSISPAWLEKLVGLLRELLASETISYKSLEQFMDKPCASLRLAVPGAMLSSRFLSGLVHEFNSRDGQYHSSGGPFSIGARSRALAA
jgi:hypothetical protein